MWQYVFQKREFNIKIMQKKENLKIVSELNSDSYQSMQGQLQFKSFNYHIPHGSGCLLLIKSGEPAKWQACVLTSANNLVYISKEGNQKKIEQFSDFRYSYSAPSIINPFGIFESHTMEWYQDYNNSNEEGNNIGLVWLENAYSVFDANAPNAKNLTWDKSIEELNIKKGEKIQIIGFGLNKIDLLYQLETTITNIKKTNSNHFVLYYEPILRQGLQGSPILLNRNNIYQIIGVHNGLDQTKKYGVGTGINNQIKQWMSDMIYSQK